MEIGGSPIRISFWISIDIGGPPFAPIGSRAVGWVDVLLFFSRPLVPVNRTDVVLMCTNVY